MPVAPASSGPHGQQRSVGRRADLRSQANVRFNGSRDALSKLVTWSALGPHAIGGSSVLGGHERSRLAGELYETDSYQGVAQKAQPCCRRLPGGREPRVTASKTLPIRLRVAERANDNAPSADRIVCRGRAGKCVAPPRASVLDGRQPTEREVEAAATGGPATTQGGVSIRIASFRSNRRTLGQRTVSVASLAWRALCLLADAQMLPRLDAPGRGHWAQLPRDPRPLPQNARGR
jgi:hypothetical protein